MVEDNIIKLSKIEKYRKFQLAAVVGYKVTEDKENHVYSIIGADNYIDNHFRSIDEILLLIKNELKCKGFIIA